MVAELFHTDGRTDGRTDRQTDRQSRRSKQSPFAILRTPIINPYHIQIRFVHRREHFGFILKK
jgi:hypothetical protein